MNGLQNLLKTPREKIFWHLMFPRWSSCDRKRSLLVVNVKMNQNMNKDCAETQWTENWLFWVKKQNWMSKWDEWLKGEQAGTELSKAQPQLLLIYVTYCCRKIAIRTYGQWAFIKSQFLKCLKFSHNRWTSMDRGSTNQRTKQNVVDL